MEEVTKLHNEAMDLADKAFFARSNGQCDKAQELTRLSFEKESQAARLVSNIMELEPTRSVLHRSAASLALECGELREAERLISQAMAGNPPEEIAEELRDLLGDVNFQRHLSLHGISLRDNEFQFSIDGAAVGHGISPSEPFINRVQKIQTLLYRTAERHMGKPFREAGRRIKEFADDFKLYVSAPRPASFAITFRIGKGQLSIPGIDNLGKQVIKDFMDGIELISMEKLDELKNKIGDESYYTNFVALSKELAPDGKDLRTVGFTTKAAGEELRIAFLKPKVKVRPKKPVKATEKEQYIEIRGTLLEADAKRQQEGKIEIVDIDNNQTYQVKVPRGMMSDIVKPMFEERVVVRGRLIGERLVYLDEINLDDGADIESD